MKQCLFRRQMLNKHGWLLKYIARILVQNTILQKNLNKRADGKYKTGFEADYNRILFKAIPSMMTAILDSPGEKNHHCRGIILIFAITDSTEFGVELIPTKFSLTTNQNLTIARRFYLQI